ncbi:lambda-exonuclease family protein [Ottowia sp.]|uniref:lambda-exonuclease family protein n=1 Tax=Ottowia sp. TaxID=1898956 RepID=UPI0025D49AE3|nr:YqaJ viral recombinase family protein [Ottowia sp.]MBK6616200.1 YqaJ viral recombinase family protein [Ottowia sp.]
MNAPLQIPGCKVINLQQRSPEWHAWRSGLDLPDGKPRITGTVAAIIAGDSVTGKTAHQLWMEMTGRKAREEPSEFLRRLFEHGERTEVIARAAYERMTGNRVYDLCVEHPDHPWAAASLDGLTEWGDILWEGKSPISQRVHTMAKRQTVPSYYYPQVQWQLMCTPTAIEAHYFSYFEDDEEGITSALVVVRPNPEYQARLFMECLHFRVCVIENRPPASNAYLMAGKNFRQAKHDAEEAEANLKAAQLALTDALPEGRDSYDGGGILTTRFYANTTVDWPKAFKDEEVADDLVAKAVEETRELGPVDYAKLMDDLGLPPERVKELEDRNRVPGPVDYKKAATTLGFTKSEIRLLEKKYKGGGDKRFRVTVTADYVPVVVSPTDGSPLPSPTSNQIVLAPEVPAADQTGLAMWDGW